MKPPSSFVKLIRVYRMPPSLAVTHRYDRVMAITVKDAADVKNWMDERAPAAACPLCRRAGEWLVGATVELPGADDGAGHSPVVMWAVPIACKNCAHVEFLDVSIITGLSGQPSPRSVP